MTTDLPPNWQIDTVTLGSHVYDTPLGTMYLDKTGVLAGPKHRRDFLEPVLPGEPDLTVVAGMVAKYEREVGPVGYVLIPRIVEAWSPSPDVLGYNILIRA